jgi:hypothetical protein
MGYNFKKFEGRNVRNENRITITKSNSMGFPQKFYNDNGIKDYKYVVFFYDEANKAIAIHFTNDELEKNKFTIMHSNDGYGGSVIARSFFKTNNIIPETHHGRYEWKKINEEGVGELFVFELDKNK